MVQYNNPIVWDSPLLVTPFQCFIKGCKEQAEYVAKIPMGKEVIQVCLCSKCRRKSIRAILEALVKGSDRPLN